MLPPGGPRGVDAAAGLDRWRCRNRRPTAARSRCRWRRSCSCARDVARLEAGDLRACRSRARARPRAAAPARGPRARHRRKPSTASRSSSPARRSASSRAGRSGGRPGVGQPAFDRAAVELGPQPLDRDAVGAERRPRRAARHGLICAPLAALRPASQRDQRSSGSLASMLASPAKPSALADRIEPPAAA